MRNIQYHYMQDTEQPLRVLTVATQKLGQDNFRISYCVNRVEKTVHVDHYRDYGDGMLTKRTEEVVAYDRFSKELARKVTTGRLDLGKHTLDVQVAGSVRDSVLMALANSESVPRVVRKIAEQQLAVIPLYKNTKNLDSLGTD